MKVFISYAREDAAVARRIAEGLRSAGLEVWYDESEIMPGENFAEKISQALEESQAMVVVITRNALRSSWVRREIQYALGRESYSGRLVPVIADRMEEIPENQIPWILKRLKMIVLPEAGREAHGIQEIAAALDKAS